MTRDDYKTMSKGDIETELESVRDLMNCCEDPEQMEELNCRLDVLFCLLEDCE